MKTLAIFTFLIPLTCVIVLFNPYVIIWCWVTCVVAKVNFRGKLHAGFRERFTYV